jgi:hypothetical protein
MACEVHHKDRWKYEKEFATGDAVEAHDDYACDAEA